MILYKADLIYIKCAEKEKEKRSIIIINLVIVFIAVFIRLCTT